MAFYYIKSGGTATGDAGRATTARTGSFATMGRAAYYDIGADDLKMDDETIGQFIYCIETDAPVDARQMDN